MYVLQRINGHVDGYAPIGLPADFQIVGSDDEVLEPGKVPELSEIPNGR